MTDCPCGGRRAAGRCPGRPPQRSPSPSHTFYSGRGEKQGPLVEHLRRAFELVHRFVDWSKTDADLDGIRGLPGYPGS